MKFTLMLAVGFVLLLPAAAQAGPAECARLRRQVDHYSGMVDRAEVLGNQMWAERTQQHVDLLRARQSQSCPEDVPVDKTGEAIAALMKLAGKAALTYFTFGAF